MKKKMISVLLTAAMIMSLSACGQEEAVASGGESGGAASSEAGTGEGTADSTQADAQEDLNLYGFDEPVTVKLGISYSAASDFTFYGGETVKDNTWVDLYKENNIIPEIMYEVDPSQKDAKLSTAIMSGDYPDIFDSTGSEYKNYVDSGVVADITEAYEKYASEELKKYMNFDGGMALESLYVDGRLYGLPKVGDPYSSVHVMWIRQDWLDRLGMKVPETMEELKEVAHAFTYDDPDGNGKNDTYGLALDGINVINDSVGNTEPFFRAYGAYLGKDGLTWLEDENGDIIWGGANKEGMKAALQLLQDMYKDGTLAKDFVTMDQQSVFNEAGAGHCGIWFGPNWGGMEPALTGATNDINCHIVAAPVPTGTGEPTKGYASSTANTIYCVSSKCENPELLVKLWNLSVKYQNAEYCTAEEYTMYFGDSLNYTGQKTSIIPGEGANGRATNEALVAALESGDSSTLTTKQLENYTSIKAYMDAVEAGAFDPADPLQQRGLSLYTVHADPQCAWKVLRTMMDRNDYVQAAYNGVPSEEVSNASATLKKLLVETIVKTITGAQNPDSYDAFLDTWYAMGGQTAIDEVKANLAN